MATLALPFDVVQENVTFVASGVSIAERMHALRKFVSKVGLTPAYHDIVNEQRRLIAELDRGMVNLASSEELSELASRLEKLVASTEQLIETAIRVDFPLWNSYVRQMSRQSEKLDSIAEAYRLSASQQHMTYVEQLVVSADGASSLPDNDWREFVGSLQN